MIMAPKQSRTVSVEGVYRHLVDTMGDVLEGRATSDVLEPLVADLPEMVDAVVPKVLQDDAIMLVIDRTGKVLSVNGATMQRLDIAVGEDLGLIAVSNGSYRYFVQTVMESTQPVPLAVTQRDGRNGVLVGMATPSGGDILLRESNAGRTAGLGRHLSHSFGLIPSELQVLSLLMKGRSIEEIAGTLSRKDSTVRQLVKSILAKMGVHAQAQAVALSFSLALTLERMTVPGMSLARAEARGTLENTPGGMVAVHRFGLRGGMPALLFHGALFGIAPLPEIRIAAEMIGLDVLAPERPGYGQTLLPDEADPVALAIRQAVAVLDTQQIERVVVISHDIGTYYAAAFAAAHPRRVLAIVAAPATPPMQGWAQTADMPTRHRINAWAAQRMPSLMDRIVRLSVAQVARKGIELLPHIVFADCAFDLAAWQRPDLEPALQEAFSLMVQQDSRGFRRDMGLTNLDWSALAARLSVPFLAMHGLESRTVSRQAVSSLCAMLGAGKAMMVPDAGHTMPLTHAALIFREAMKLGLLAESDDRA